MNELVFLLEEQSAKAMLEGVLPRLRFVVPPVRYVVFEGKQDLDRNIVRRLRGYRNPDARFVIVRDQDSAPDCVALKQRLVGLCVEAGRPDAVVRIMCRELETIYLADLAAVALGVGLPGLGGRQLERKFRMPDRLSSPSAEIKVLTRGMYQKIAGSRSIGAHLDIDNGRSASFQQLLAGILKACA